MTSRTIARLTLALAAISLVWPLAAFGQGGRMGKGPPSADERLAQLTRKLDLTQEQQEKIAPILKTHEEQMRTLHEKARSSEGGRGALRDQMRAARQDFEKQVEGVLTESQAAEFRKLQDQRRQRMRRHMEGGGPNDGDGGA